MVNGEQTFNEDNLEQIVFLVLKAEELLSFLYYTHHSTTKIVLSSFSSLPIVTK